MKDIKQMPTAEIMSFLDAITVMDEEIDRVVRVTWTCFDNEGINEVEREDILDAMKAEVLLIEPVRLKLVKEITRRFKHNFGLSKGPFEIKECIAKIAAKYTNLGLTKAEIDLVKAKAKKTNLKKT